MERMAASVVLAIQTALKPVLARVEHIASGVLGLEARLAELNALADRIKAFEDLSRYRGEPGPAGKDGADGLEGKAGPEGLPGRDGLNGRDGAQGLQGEPGANGGPGQNGLNGRDGTIDNVKLVQVDERTWQWCFKNGDPVEGGTMHFDTELYRGVWLDGKAYERGDGVTWGGSEWHCNEPTSTKPGDGAKAWTLKVKRGRDGKDAAPIPPTTVPIVRTK
jgi:hypothetical protein